MKTSRQILMFSLIGFINTFVHYLVFLSLFRYFGLPMLVASSCGYLVGVINSYYLNRTWTFQIGSKINLVEFIEFVLVNLVSMGANLLALHFLVNSLEIIPEIAQVLAIGFSLVINFTGNKIWTFRSKPAI